MLLAVPIARHASADQVLPSGTPTAAAFSGTPTVGPLFANSSSSHHFCTASVINSPRGDVLLTAAHCIRGTAAGYVFAPGFHDGISPYGRWVVTAAYLDPGWLNHGDPARDFAFLTVAPKWIAGRPEDIQAVTGGNRLAFGGHVGQQVTITGYPAGADNEPVRCSVRLYYDGAYPAFNCDPYVGGTSGAPWLLRTAQGSAVVGVIGGLHQGGCYPYISYSPPLGAAALRAYERAAAGVRGDRVPSAGGDGC